LVSKEERGKVMQGSLKRKRIFAAVTDVFIFSVLVRVLLFGCYQAGLKPEWALFLSLFSGGLLNYVGIPLIFGKQTLGMRMNGLMYSFVKKGTFENGLILTLRFIVQFVLNVVFLGAPLALNLFFLLWRREGHTLTDQLFSRVMSIDYSLVIRKG
jgi:hypothetical protein